VLSHWNAVDVRAVPHLGGSWHMWVGVSSERNIGKKKLWVFGLEFEESAGFHSVAHPVQRWVDLERKFADLNLGFLD